MKKLFRTLVLCILVLAITTSAFACGKNDEEGTVEPVKKLHYEGTHIYNQTDTGKYVVKDGVTDYKIVATSSSDAYLGCAKDDSVILFEKATGIELEVIIDTGNVTYTEDAKYISIGNTSLVEQAGISPEEYSWELLGDEGVRIITKGNTIFLLGAHVLGVCYSVYVLYDLMFNFEFYQRNCMYIDTGVSNVPLMNYDVTDIPDVEHGEVACAMDQHNAASDAVNTIDALYYGGDAKKEVYLRAARALSANYSFNSLLIPVRPSSTPGAPSATVHNILTSYLNPQWTYVDPNWKSESGTQACFTAHGDSDSLEAFVEHVFERAKDAVLRFPVEQYPVYRAIPIQCSDGSTTTCMCSACTKVAQMNNGSYIASHIMFVNKVNEKFQPWMETLKDDPELSKYYRPNIQIQLFAYGESVLPPVYFDEETGEPIPCTEEVICAKGTSIDLVYHKGFYSMYDEESKIVHDYWKAWSMLTPDSDLWLWSNSGNHVVTAFYDNLASVDNDFWTALAYYDFEEVYLANHFGGSTTTSFLDLSFYVSKKLRWNCNLNMSELVDDFMNHMYGEAADAMMELYDKLKLYWYGIKARMESIGDFKSNRTWTKELWPVDVNVWWYNGVEKAVDKVSYMQEIDENEYQVLVHRIRIEAIAPLFNLIELHGKGNNPEISDDQLITYKKLLYEIIKHHPEMRPGFNEVSGTVFDRTII